MVDIATFKQMALSFPETTEEPHFHLLSYRIGKKIFTTLNEKENIAMVKFTVAEQSVYSAIKGNIFYPVPGAWGKNGSTYVDLSKVTKTLLKEALRNAWRNVAPSKLSGTVFQPDKKS